MPKSPIQSRTGFILTNKYDKTQRLGQFNLVDTPLGICVEPRNMNMANVPAAQVLDIDVYEQSFTRFVTEDADQFFQLYGTGGSQISEDFSPQA